MSKRPAEGYLRDWGCLFIFWPLLDVWRWARSRSVPLWLAVLWMGCWLGVLWWLLAS